MQRVTRDAGPDHSGLADLVQTVAIISKHFPPSVAQLYARPRAGNDGVREWWTELEGQPRLYRELNAEQQSALLGVYEQRQDAIGQLAAELEQRGQTGDASALRRLIGPANLDNLYSVNGYPLLVRWDTPVVVATPPPPVAPAAKPRRRWIFWLPWFLLPLLALLAILAALWFGCPYLRQWFGQTPQPNAVEQPVISSETAITPAPELPLPTPEPEPVPEPEPEPPVAPEPPPVAKPKQAEASAPPKPPVCRKYTKNQPPQLAVVFDTSGSMNLSVDASLKDEMWFFRNLDNPFADPAIFARITQPPVRMDVAKQSLTQMVKDLHPAIDMRLVTFNGCRTPVDHGVFGKAQRPALIRGIQGLKADDGTALSASLEMAASSMNGRDRDGVIVMFADGEDGCGRNICEVAQRIAQDQPRLKVNLINISTNSLADCVAQRTGGQVYSVNNASQLDIALEQASQEVSANTNCE